MKLVKLSSAKKIQLLIIPVVVLSFCFLGMLWLSISSLALSVMLYVCFGFLGFALLLLSAIAFKALSRLSIEPHDKTQSNMKFIKMGSTHMTHPHLENSIELTGDELTNQLQARRYMEMLIRAALSNQEFTLLYQPKLSTKTGRICGAEALVRWFHPELGWFSPNEFIPIAEETGLIIPLGHWVIKTVCEKIKKWHEMGFEHLKISLNLSAYQFRKGDIVEDIANVLWETQIAPYSLELELTESVLMENTEKCVLMLDVLKSMGISISIDDFGTGYSSLSYLRRFPIDALKIDKSFVNNINEKTQEDTIIRAIIAMAKGLKIKTIAEGVETKEQANYLIKHEVDELQGYYISMPLTEDEFTTQLYEDNAQVVALKH
ncbi:MAG: EAL domain-containing protein [Proteobacteria bacterium]|nr:EAL domain-containing protein [Pseudomonadota bacterium]